MHSWRYSERREKMISKMDAGWTPVDAETSSFEEMELSSDVPSDFEWNPYGPTLQLQILGGEDVIKWEVEALFDGIGRFYEANLVVWEW